VSLALVPLVLATQGLAGWLVLRGLAPDLARRWTAAVPRALLLGPAALALQMLALEAAGRPLSLAWVLGPWWAAAGLLAWRARTRGAQALAPRGPEVRGPAHLAALALACVLGGLALGTGLLQPLVAGDPVTNAALVGRVVATHGRLDAAALQALQAPAFAAYPPLVAFNEALLFRAAGESWARAALPFFALAQLALLLLLVEACFERLRPARALPLALALLLAPTLATGGASGYFDERFAACVLLLGLTLRELDERPDAGRAALAAAAALGCALTKPQGLVPAVLAALLLALRLGRGRLPARAALPALALLAAGVAAWPLLAGARGVHTPPDLVPHWPGVHEALARTGAALDCAARVALPPAPGAFAAWGLAWPLLLALSAAALARRATRAAAALPLACAALHLLAYAGLAACTQLDVDWLLATGLPRWLLHLLPWLLLAGATALEDPPE